MSNILPKLSYFEFQREDGDFVSRFPSEKTTSGAVIVAEDSEKSWVFSKPMPTETDVYDHLTALVENRLLFSDFYWFMKPSTSYTATEIIHWLGSLYFDSPSVTAYHVKYVIRSVIDPTFEMPAHKTAASLPQEAIDSIPVCRTDKSVRVLLGRRAANPPVVVTFSKMPSLCIKNDDGYILYGEHLLPEKKKQIEQSYVSFLAGDSPYLEISEQDASEALRAVYEEGGLQLSGKVKAYMLEKDSAPGRDIRYWTFMSKTNHYGYERKSSSFNVLLIIPTIDSLPEPIDTIECQKGVILSKDIINSEFRVGGQYNPVFPSHVRQLKNALNIVDLIN